MNLRECRLAGGFSASDLAQVCGVHPTSVYRWECGTRRVPKLYAPLLRILLINYYRRPVPAVVGLRADGTVPSPEIRKLLKELI